MEQEIKVAEDRKWSLTDQCKLNKPCGVYSICDVVKLNNYKLQKINEQFECVKKKRELQKEKQTEANEIDDKIRTVVL